MLQAWGFFAAIDQPLLAKARLTDFLKVTLLGTLAEDSSRFTKMSVGVVWKRTKGLGAQLANVALGKNAFEQIEKV